VHINRVCQSIEFYPCYASLDLQLFWQSMKVYMLLDPHVPMLKGWVGPSSFPRIMSLKVVFQIYFDSIKMMGMRGGISPT
jgi:hypothetical protein